MVELLVVLALLVGLIGAPALVAFAPWEITFGAGLVLVALGMLIGVPAGAYYHVQLYRALKPTGLWWLHPIPLHKELKPADRPAVMRWMRVGAVMFGVIIVGLALATVGVVRAK